MGPPKMIKPMHKRKERRQKLHRLKGCHITCVLFNRSLTLFLCDGLYELDKVYINFVVYNEYDFSCSYFKIFQLIYQYQISVRCYFFLQKNKMTKESIYMPVYILNYCVLTDRAVIMSRASSPVNCIKLSTPSRIRRCVLPISLKKSPTR